MKKIIIALIIASIAITGCSKPSEPAETEETVDLEEQERLKKEEEEKRLAAEKAEEEAKRLAEEEAKRKELENAPKSPLSGLPVDPEVLENRVMAVMIDNHQLARPQSGISKAEIVYEYEVESDITRYLALFLANDVEDIGPIRSLRPYYINTVMEYDAVITRYGGSDDADYEVAELGIDQIDGMALSGNYIWRDNSKGKVAPHNAYSSTSAIKEAITNMGYHSGPAVGVFEYNLEDAQLTGTDAKRVYLGFSSSGAAEFNYDEATKEYKRNVGGVPHVDEIDGAQVTAKNIIVQLVNMGYYANGVHRTVDNVGEGTGYYITNGVSTEITWKKDSREAKTQFLDADGNPIKLNPGHTWVEVFNLTKELIIE